MGKTSHIGKALLPAVFLLLPLSSGMAAEQDGEESAKWYEIEIILFEHTRADNLDSEMWPAEHAMPELRHAIDLFPEPDPAAGTQSAAGPAEPTPLTASPVPPYMALKQEELRLRDMYRALERSPGRTPLLHLGWRQPTVEKEAAIPVHIHGGRKFVRNGPQPLENLIETNTAPGLSVPTAPSARHEVVEQINGTITISRIRYLHVWTDLIFSTERIPSRHLYASDEGTDTKAQDGILATLKDLQDIIVPHDGAATNPAMDSSITMDSATATNPQLFSLRIQEHRRMRSTEVHYLDHPLVGMLILATPYEIPAGETETGVDTTGSEVKAGTSN